MGCLPGRPHGRGWGEKEITTQARLLMHGMLEGYGPVAAEAEGMSRVLGAWHTIDGEPLAIVGALPVLMAGSMQCVWGKAPESLRLVSSADPSLAGVVDWTAVSVQHEGGWRVLHSHEDLRQLLLAEERSLSVLFVPPMHLNTVSAGMQLFFRQEYAQLLTVVKEDKAAKRHRAEYKAIFKNITIYIGTPAMDHLPFVCDSKKNSAYRMPLAVSDWPTLPLTASCDLRHKRDDWLETFRMKVLYVAIGLNSSKVRGVKPKFLLKTLVAAATEVCPLAGELARRVTYDDVLSDEAAEEDDLHMVLAWSRANTNGDTVVDARELGQLNMDAKTCPPDVRDALSLRNSSDDKGLSFDDFRKLWTDLVDVPELRTEFSARQHNGKLSPAALSEIIGADCELTKSLSFAEFIRFMKTPAKNGALREEDQDLDQPLAHYFIACSHNTYLCGHQLWGQSSADQYKSVIVDGSCRCVEVDVWESPTGALVVTHGFTATSKVPLAEVLDAINAVAFSKTDLPLIISVEEHCSPAKQVVLASEITRAFGPRLLRRSEAAGLTLTPGGLRMRVLVKSRHGPKEMNDVIALPGGEDWPPDEPNRVVSRSESKLEGITPQTTAGRLYRSYPRGTRTASDNYDVQEAWNAGVQLIAMNYQRVDSHMRQYVNRFTPFNEGCGYMLKPNYFLNKPITDGCVLQVEVLRAWRLPHGFAGKTSTPYVTVELRGVKSDMASAERLCTPSVKQNGFSPSWINCENTQCTFTMVSAGASFLVLQVLDRDPLAESFDTTLAEAVLPVACIKPGLRSVRLHSAKGLPLKETGIMCRFTFTQLGSQEAPASPPAPAALPPGDLDLPLDPLEPLLPAVTEGDLPAGGVVPTPVADLSDVDVSALQGIFAPDGLTPGFPAVAQYKRGWLCTREGSNCAFVAKDGEYIPRVLSTQVTPICPPDEMDRLLKVPRVLWLWRHLVPFYAAHEPVRIGKAAEIAAKYAGHEDALLHVLQASYPVRHTGDLAFIALPPPYPITEQEKGVCRRLAAALKARRKEAVSVHAILEEQVYELQRLQSSPVRGAPAADAQSFAESMSPVRERPRRNITTPATGADPPGGGMSVHAAPMLSMSMSGAGAPKFPQARVPPARRRLQRQQSPSPGHYV